MNQNSSLNYVSYLKVDQILTAQEPKSTGPDGFEHDEMLFIVIHQVYELWFKQILHEIDRVNALLQANELSPALATMQRILTILKTVVGQIDILETMTPLQFNSFRKFLDNSSGFQSVQFREVEFSLGYKRKTMIDHFPEGLYGRKQLIARFEAPSLWDNFLGFLKANDYAVPDSLLNRDVTAPINESAELQQVLLDVYRNDVWIGRLCERLVDLDEGLQEWRYRHVKMVARTIGAKMGTGGSSGVKYLESTLRPMWPDLWAIRSEL
ncbi:MAG: tryptophan 2,3-dioxygenase [Cellvibrionaceae bacterium]|jgi:tryptophan 2,3-dioxygenase